MTRAHQYQSNHPHDYLQLNYTRQASRSHILAPIYAKAGRTGASEHKVKFLLRGNGLLPYTVLRQVGKPNLHYPLNLERLGDRAGSIIAQGNIWVLSTITSLKIGADQRAKGSEVRLIFALDLPELWELSI